MSEIGSIDHIGWIFNVYEKEVVAMSRSPKKLGLKILTIERSAHAAAPIDNRSVAMKKRYSVKDFSLLYS